MSLVMSDNFVGSPGGAFTGDAVYNIQAGSPSLAACSYGVGVRFPAVAQTIIQEVFTATSGPRVFSRIYRINGTPTVGTDILRARLASDGSGSWGVQINSTGKLVLYSHGSTQTVTSTAALPVGVEFRVVYTLNAAGTTITAAIYPDLTSTTPTQTLSVTTTVQSISKINEGLITATGLGAGVTLDLIWPQDDNTADPGLRIYVAASLDLATGIVPKAVTATATVQNSPAGTKAWTFHWGDGATTGPQAGNTATHTYTVAGTYSVTVDLDVT